MLYGGVIIRAYFHGIENNVYLYLVAQSYNPLYNIIPPTVHDTDVGKV